MTSLIKKTNALNIPSARKGFSFLWKTRQDPLNAFTQLMLENGPHVWFEILGKPVLLLNDAKAIQHVFQDNFNGYKKGEFNEVLRPLLGNGIFLSEKDTWKQQRRESAPVFANKNFPDMFEQMVAAAEFMFVRWDKKIAKNEPINLDVEMMWFAFDVVLRALFHEKKENVATGLKDALGVLLKDAEKRIWAVASVPQKLVLLLPKYKKSLNYLNNVVEDLVNSRELNKTYPEDLLSRLINSYAHQKNGKATLRDQVMSFLLAGHETTANALTWTLYEISKRPDNREKIEHEIDTVLKGKAPTLESIESLKYTAAAFEESMRLYPPVWAISRQALEDDHLPTETGDTVFVPKNASVMLCAYTTHRQEKYWKDPEAFDPNRFLETARESRPKFAYFPFGGGQRLCLGHRFAMIESVLVLALITQRYELSLIPGQKILHPEPIITLRPDKTVLYNLKKRTLKSNLDSSIVAMPKKENVIKMVCPITGESHVASG